MKKFWWVNHKQTFNHEVQGGFIWCPKRKANGAQNHFYETVREVRPGDIVLSYAFAAVQAAGIARTYCYSCPQPDEFGRIGTAWDIKGWRVDVDFQRFQAPLRTAATMHHLAELLPTKYSPIRKSDGFGNQGAYLAQISKPLVMKVLELAAPFLLDLARDSNIQEDQPLTERTLESLSDWEEDQSQTILSTVEAHTERIALIKARVGQGTFRQRVSEIERFCRVTNVVNPEHLVASHIKPWRESTNEERLAGANGLLLTPNIDHLFDRGFISFDDDGELLQSPVADPFSLERMGVRQSHRTTVGNFNSDQKYFLNYHRSEIFLKSAS